MRTSYSLVAVLAAAAATVATATAATDVAAAAATVPTNRPTKESSKPGIAHAYHRGPGCSRAGAEVLGVPALVRGGADSNNKHTARDPELTAERAAIAHATRSVLTLTAVFGCFLMVTPRGKYVGVALFELVLVVLLAILLPPGKARWLVAY